MYDSLNRLIRRTDPAPLSYETSYTYDRVGNRRFVADANGNVTAFEYDERNLVLVESRPLAAITHTSYDDMGDPASVCDPEERVTTVTADTYDGNGNRLSQTDALDHRTSFEYDVLNRRTATVRPATVTEPAARETYDYDANGNRLTEQATDTTGDSGGTLVTDKLFTYDERDRLLALTDRLAPEALESTDYGYDANGNQTARTKAGVTTTFHYSVRNRLTEVREASTLVGSYLYDHQGLRVAKRSGTGQTIRYVYDDQSVLLQTDLTGSTITKYDYGADRLLSLDNVTAGRQYYLFDALGSVVDLTDAAGAIQIRYVYDAWGNHRRTAGTSPNPFGFTGHELDDETGLYYAKARYYDPELGIFLTQDPFEGSTRHPAEPASVSLRLPEPDGVQRSDGAADRGDGQGTDCFPAAERWTPAGGRRAPTGHGAHHR